MIFIKLIQPFKNALFIIICLLIFTMLCGCKVFMELKNKILPSDKTDISSMQSQYFMPQVYNTDLDKTGKKLSSAGFIVMVKREKVVIKESGKEFAALPEIIQSFQAGRWNHMIAAQEPAAGTSVRTGTVVLLTAGMHHGAGPFRPWIESHKIALIYIGKKRCMDCHTSSYCLDCHAKVGK